MNLLNRGEVKLVPAVGGCRGDGGHGPIKRIRVLLVDDHAIVREGVKRLLDGEPEVEVVGECDNGGEAVTKVSELQPDIVVMDLSMPGMSGLEAMRLVQHSCPAARVIALTVHEDERHVQESLQTGARGYLLKRTLPELIPRAIRTVLAGGIFVDPRIYASLPSALVESGGDSSGPDLLSDRETSVLRGIAFGYSNKELADQLSISVQTVETYKARAMEKLGLRSRVDIVRLANQRGWMETPPAG